MGSDALSQDRTGQRHLARLVAIVYPFAAIISELGHNRNPPDRAKRKQAVAARGSRRVTSLRRPNEAARALDVRG